MSWGGLADPLCVCVYILCALLIQVKPRWGRSWSGKGQQGSPTCIHCIQLLSFAFLSGTKIINAQQDKATRVSLKQLHAMGLPFCPAWRRFWLHPPRQWWDEVSVSTRVTSGWLEEFRASPKSGLARQVQRFHSISKAGCWAAAARRGQTPSVSGGCRQTLT